MLVVIRFSADEGSDPAVDLQPGLERARACLAQCRGYLDGDIGRNVDDPGLWTLVTRWADVGSYRRALSSYEVRVNAVPVLSRAINEPTAYETTPGPLNDPGARQLG